MEQSNIILKTKNGVNLFIGYEAVIQVETVLGKHCIVGSNSVVKGSFDDYSVIAGVPARVIKITTLELPSGKGFIKKVIH